jgi:hypothetical protein
VVAVSTWRVGSKLIDDELADVAAAAEPDGPTPPELKARIVALEAENAELRRQIAEVVEASSRTGFGLVNRLEAERAAEHAIGSGGVRR